MVPVDDPTYGAVFDNDSKEGKGRQSLSLEERRNVNFATTIDQYEQLITTFTDINYL